MTNQYAQFGQGPVFFYTVQKGFQDANYIHHFLQLILHNPQHITGRLF